MSGRAVADAALIVEDIVRDLDGLCLMSEVLELVPCDLRAKADAGCRHNCRSCVIELLTKAV
jgi:hypothetical protein